MKEQNEWMNENELQITDLWTYLAQKYLMFWQSPETQNGALFGLGYLIGQLLQKQTTKESNKGSSLQQKIQKRIEVAVKAIGRNLTKTTGVHFRSVCMSVNMFLSAHTRILSS